MPDYLVVHLDGESCLFAGCFTHRDAADLEYDDAESGERTHGNRVAMFRRDEQGIRRIRGNHDAFAAALSPMVPAMFEIMDTLAAEDHEMEPWGPNHM